MAEQNDPEVASDDLLRMTTQIASAFVSSQPVDNSELKPIIESIHSTLSALANGTQDKKQNNLKPAVPIKRSITPDYLICLEDGKKLKMLKRYLRSNFGMTPEEYRAKWNLPPDYPMVAPNYAAQRSKFAKQIGLGKQSRRA